MAIRGVYELKRDNPEDFRRWESALSMSWEEVLFAAIDALHSLEQGGYSQSREIKRLLLPQVANEQFDPEATDKAINLTKDLMDEVDRKYVTDHIRKTLEKLYAVKVTMRR